jgi:2-polyprenyl-3-methyl-5-hydroxy-6-metoxy-1,4-benzoquinol methylase
MNSEPTLLYEEIQAHYQVGQEFTRQYLKGWLADPERQYHCLEDFLTAPSPLPLWFDYAMSTNLRGQYVVRLLKPYIPAGAKRTLDVGCGYGGFVVAFSQHGFESYGIELEPARVELSNKNCKDYGLQDRIFQINVLEPDLKERLGTFDVITCNDVIEHVMDMPLAMKNITQLLNPGGILLMEIPNKDSLAFLGRDGHYELFGITQLPRAEAAAYHYQIFGDEYGVGEYYELGVYQELLRQHGCSSRLLNLPGSIKMQAPPAIKTAWQGYQRYRREHQGKLPAELRRKTSIRALQYLAGMGSRALFGVFTAQGRQALRSRYLSDFWTVLAVKNSG